MGLQGVGMLEAGLHVMVMHAVNVHGMHKTGFFFSGEKLHFHVDRREKKCPPISC
jgi:hypothetical protein